MLQARLRNKITRFLLLSGLVSLMVWGFCFYLRDTGFSGKSRHYDTNEHNSYFVNQMTNLKDKYIMFKDKVQPASPILQEKEHILAELKESSLKIQEQIENLNHQLRQLASTQQDDEAQPPQTTSTSINEFIKRKHRVGYVCSSVNVSGGVMSVHTHKSGVIYCTVPKAGCTFWKRIFAADNASMEKINAISREFVHTPERKGVQYNSSFNATLYPTRFIVTRDPYSRLLSSYIDKVYLPDFWLSEVVPMIKQRPIRAPLNSDTDFLRKHFDNMAALFSRNGYGTRMSTAIENKCGKYMTFSEFVVSGFDRDEPHWMPIHQVCNPCIFNVTHVSTMETFTQDARVILAQMEMEGAIDGLNENAQIDEEIDTISKYNFHRFYREDVIYFYKVCLKPREIAYRLWHNFQWRGYIDPDVEYIIPKFRSRVKIEEDFMNQVRSARKSGLQNLERMMAAKKEFKRKAFATISKSMFEKLSNKYELDFKLFGYTDVRDEMYFSYYND